MKKKMQRPVETNVKLIDNWSDNNDREDVEELDENVKQYYEYFTFNEKNGFICKYKDCEQIEILENEMISHVIKHLKHYEFETPPKPSEIPSLDIPITESDRQLLLSIGKIKHQKQRPSIDRLYNICNKIKDKFPEFGSRDGIQSVLNDMISRNLLRKVDNEKGLIYYRELNSAIPIVLITNPKRSRAKPKVLHKRKSFNSVNSSPRKRNRKKFEEKSILGTEESISRVLANDYYKPLSPQPLPEPLLESLSPKQLKQTLNNTKESEQLSKCGICGIAGEDSQLNQLITCSLCGMSGHSHCLGCPQHLLKRIQESSYWECPNCKKCPKCSLHDNQLIICCVCDRGFHPLCIQVSNSFSVSNWICKDCKPKTIKSSKKSSQISITSISSTAIKIVTKQLTEKKKIKKSSAQLKAEKLRKNAEKAAAIRKKRAKLKLKLQINKEKAQQKAAKPKLLLRKPSSLLEESADNHAINESQDRQMVFPVISDTIDSKSVETNNKSKTTTGHTNPLSSQPLPQSISLTKLLKYKNQTQNNTKQSEQLPKCQICGIAGEDSQLNELITCSLCGMSGHSHCLGCSQHLLKRIKRFPYWECPQCKKCLICSSHDKDLIVCGSCDRAVHQNCIQTSDKHSIMNWIDCKDCNPNLIKTSNDSCFISIDISPIDDYDNEELESILIRAGLQLPNKYSGNKYRKKLIKIIQKKSPKVTYV